MRCSSFYRWVVAGASFVIMGLVFGTRNCFGVFFKSIASEFDLTRTAASSIFSVYMMLSPIFSILGGWVFDKYGPKKIIFFTGFFCGLSFLLTSKSAFFWQLFISYSLLFSMGTGPAYSVLMSTAAGWFEEKRGLAMGIVGSGAGLGALILTPFAAFLIASYEWRTASAVLGLIAGLGIVSSSLVLTKNTAQFALLADVTRNASSKLLSSNKSNYANQASLSLPQALRTRNFWFLAIVWLLSSTCLYLVTTHIVPYITDIGVPSADAAIVLGLISSNSIPGRLIMGGASDKLGRKVPAAICGLLQVASMLWLASTRELWMFYFFTIVFGFTFGGFQVIVTAIIADIFGLDSLGAIIGALVVGWGIGAGIGPLLGGLIHDITGSYFLAFLLGAFAILIATLFVSLLEPRQNSRVQILIR